MKLLLALFVLAFLQATLATECFSKICHHAFAACNNTGYSTEDCWDWADEVFHCCDECADCKTPKVAAAQPAIERHCHPKICDTVLRTCYKIHDNTSECQERADKAGHCCYSCMDCPPTTPKPQSDSCKSNLCQGIWNVCNSSGDASPTECWKIADDAASCCHECGSCDNANANLAVAQPEPALIERHCHPKICDTVLKTCYRIHDNTSECQDRADKAGHCCYSCMDCPPDTPKPKSDSCKSNLCEGIWNACNISGDYSPDECWKMADDAASCCDECGTCDLQAGKHKKRHHRQCEPLACEKSFHVCRSWLGVDDHKACWDIVDHQFGCCDRCHNCS